MKNLLVLCLFCVLAGPLFAQFQPMRIPAGTYELRDNQLINTYCIQLGTPNPGTGNNFKAGSKGIMIHRTLNGKTTQIPLNEALQHNYIQLTGTESGNSIRIKITDPEHATYEMKVTEGAVVAGSEAEVAASTELLLNKEKAFQPLDLFRKQLEYAFGPESGVLKYFVEQTTDANQMLRMEASNIQAQVEDDLKKFWDAVTEQSDRQALEYLTIMHGAPLNAQQVQRATQLFKKQLPKEYRPTFLKDLESYSSTQDLLIRTFGEDFEVQSTFRDMTLKSYKEAHDLKIACTLAERIGLLGEFAKWDAVEGNDGLIALFRGAKMSARQQTTLGEVTGFEFRSSPGAFADYAYLIKGDDDRFNGYAVRTTEQYQVLQNAADLLPLLKSHPNLCYSGEMDQDLLAVLNAAGIRYFPTEEVFLRNPPVERHPIRLVFITSDDPKNAARIFHCDVPTAAEIVRQNEQLRKLPGVLLSDTLPSEETLRRLLKPDEKVIFVLPARMASKVKDTETFIINPYDADRKATAITADDYSIVVRTLTELQQQGQTKTADLLGLQRAYAEAYGQIASSDKRRSNHWIGFAKGRQLTMIQY